MTGREKLPPACRESIARRASPRVLVCAFGLRRRRLLRALLWTAAICALLLPRSSPAQAPLPPPSEPLRATSEAVRMTASVLGRHGEYLGGFPQGDFRVLDDGAERPMNFFSPEEAPARVLVMIETSPAVYLIRDQHLAAAYALLGGLDPADEVGLVAYDETPRALLGFTTDQSALLAALNSLQYTLGAGDLNLYDSLSAVLNGMSEAPGKTALVLLTTGLDSSPPSHWEALAGKLRGTDTVIFPVALGGALGEAAPTRRAKRGKSRPPESDAPPADRPAVFAKSDAALLEIARITGGRAYFPETGEDFVPIYRNIASALRHQYLLGIVPAHDGRFHTLTVEVGDAAQAGSGKGKKPAYRVFSRQGYQAPGP